MHLGGSDFEYVLFPNLGEREKGILYDKTGLKMKCLTLFCPRLGGTAIYIYIYGKSYEYREGERALKRCGERQRVTRKRQKEREREREREREAEREGEAERQRERGRERGREREREREAARERERERQIDRQERRERKRERERDIERDIER